MKRLLRKHEAVRCTVKHSLRSREAKHTNLDLSRRLASQDEVLLHFSCTIGAHHCNQKRKSSPLDCFHFWLRGKDLNQIAQTLFACPVATKALSALAGSLATA